MSAERTSALRHAAATRSLDAEQRARNALAALDEQGGAVTFKAVAALANVSRQFLYSRDDLRTAIEQLREQQLRAPRLPARERASEDSTRARLRATLEENKRLREALVELRDELALAHGRVREAELATRAAPAARQRGTHR